MCDSVSPRALAPYQTLFGVRSYFLVDFIVATTLLTCARHPPPGSEIFPIMEFIVKVIFILFHFSHSRHLTSWLFAPSTSDLYSELRPDSKWSKSITFQNKNLLWHALLFEGHEERLFSIPVLPWQSCMHRYCRWCYHRRWCHVHADNKKMISKSREKWNLLRSKVSMCLAGPRNCTVNSRKDQTFITFSFILCQMADTPVFAFNFPHSVWTLNVEPVAHSLGSPGFHLQ